MDNRAALAGMVCVLITGPLHAAGTARILEGWHPADCTLPSARCPPPLSAVVEDARAWCAELDGQLIPLDDATVWVLDTTGDGRDEWLFDLSASFHCSTAPSLFSCGSTGCPRAVYSPGPDGWVSLGGVYAATPEQLTTTEEGVLYVACSDGPDCQVRQYHVLLDGVYRVSHMTVSGYRVEVEASVHGLFALNQDACVLDKPVNGAVVSRHPAGWDMALMGTTPDGRHYYVSPCRACASGFIPAEALAVSVGERASPEGAFP